MLIWPTVLARQLAKYDQSLKCHRHINSGFFKNATGIMSGRGHERRFRDVPRLIRLPPCVAVRMAEIGQFQTQPFTLPTDDVAGQERVNKADLLSAIIAHGEFV